MSRSHRESNDAVAREAARLLAIGRAADMHQAIALARQTVDAGGQPSRMQVRRHAQAIAMQSMGEAAYRQRSRDLLVTAEEIMTALEEAFPDARTLLVGRAAKGHFDADPAIHVRVLTEASTTEIAAALNRMGYRDADLAFTTLDTAHHGRLSQVQWSEDDPAVQIILTRCPNNAVFESRRDLVTSRPLAILSRDALRKELAFDTDHTR